MDEIARRGIRLPKGVTVRTVQAGGVHAEWIEPVGIETNAAILYLHGGGYCICSLDTHRGLAARLALASGIPVLLIAYRLAPEHPFPAALEDTLAAYRWLLGQGFSPKHIAIGGDSAGGGLTLACAVSLRDAKIPLPAALFCLSPWNDLTFSGETVRTLANVDPVLKLGKTPRTEYYAGTHDPANPLISPLFADLQGLPPLLIHVGADEILLSDSTRLEEKARLAGVDVSVKIWKGMWHVFQVFAPYVPEAQESINLVGTFIKRHTATTEVKQSP
jgi:acetyl esterase/lipase